MAIKKFFFLVFMSLFVHYNAQTYVKVNGFTLPALMLNAGIERNLQIKLLFKQMFLFLLGNHFSEIECFLQLGV
ncbi:MAG: hypothetical protein ACK4HC_07415 [Cloacibacterium sp.]